MKKNLKAFIFSIVMGIAVILIVFLIKVQKYNELKTIWSETLFTAIPMVIFFTPAFFFSYKIKGLKYTIFFPTILITAVIMNFVIKSEWVSVFISVVICLLVFICNSKIMRAAIAMRFAVLKNNPEKAITIGEKMLLENNDKETTIYIKLNLIFAYHRINNYQKIREILETIDKNKLPANIKTSINYWREKISSS